MKVNDYVRTDDGLIGKIVSEPYEYKDSIGHDIDFGDNNIYNEYEMYQEIIKSSPNIIDLIEENDYINGLRVEKNKYGDLYTSYTYMGGLVGTQGETYTKFLKDYDNDYIQSIVTKEQFKNMEYEVK